MAACEGCPEKVLLEVAGTLDASLADKIIDSGLTNDIPISIEAVELEFQALEAVWESGYCKKPETSIDPRDGEVLIQCSAHRLATRIVNRLVLERRVARMLGPSTEQSDPKNLPKGSNGNGSVSYSVAGGANGAGSQNSSPNGAYL